MAQDPSLTPPETDSAPRGPFVGFGCAGLAQHPDSKARQELLQAAFDSGIRHFDVARMYGLGTAEGELGRFLRGRRDEVTVTTKFGLSFSADVARASRVQSLARWLFRRVPALRAVARRRFGASTERDYSLEATRASVETSLQQLGVDSLDFLLLHDPEGAGEIPGETLDYLESLRARGKVGQIGLATGLAAAQAIAGERPTLGRVVQVPAPDDAAFGSPFLSDPGRLVLSHGYLQRHLAPLKAAVARSSDKGRPLAEAMGLPTPSAEALGAAVLLHAHSLNPRGRVLFFSSSPTRVRETMRLVSGCGGSAAQAVAAYVAHAIKEAA